MKSESDISIEQMAACMAHEIKNPLALIKAHLQLLEYEDTIASHKKNYKSINRELDRINLLISDFINITSAEKYEFSNVDIKELVNDVLMCFDGVFAQKNINLSAEYNYHSKIKGDYRKLKQVLINIYKNSIEALECIHNAEIIVTVLEKDSVISVSIQDNGTGIKQDDLKNIGTPFFTTKKSGSGLGVIFSKRIIEHHNGSFNIRGEEGNGACVYISLPASDNICAEEDYSGAKDKAPNFEIH